MTVGEIARALNAEILAAGRMDESVTGVYSGDIMSRALANGFSGMAWICAQADMNALAVAHMKGALCLIFPQGVLPGEAVVRRAEEEKIGLLSCGLTAFEAAGRIYALMQEEERGTGNADA